MEDSFATPVSKLPPPAISMRSDEAPVEAASYTDILNSMEKNQQQAAHPQQKMLPMAQPQQFGAMQPPPPPPNTPGAHQQDYYHMPQQIQQQQQQQYYTTPPPAHYMYDDHDPGMDAVPLRKKPLHPIISVDTLRERSVWLFAAIMFLAIVYGLPKLRQFPMFINPISGGLTTPAIALTSVGSGLAFTVASRFM